MHWKEPKQESTRKMFEEDEEAKGFNPILLGGGADLPPPSRICVYECVCMRIHAGRNRVKPNFWTKTLIWPCGTKVLAGTYVLSCCPPLPTEYLSATHISASLSTQRISLHCHPPLLLCFVQHIPVPPSQSLCNACHCHSPLLLCNKYYRADSQLCYREVLGKS